MYVHLQCFIGKRINTFSFLTTYSPSRKHNQNNYSQVYILESRIFISSFLLYFVQHLNNFTFSINHFNLLIKFHLLKKSLFSITDISPNYMCFDPFTIKFTTKRLNPNARKHILDNLLVLLEGL